MFACGFLQDVYISLSRMSCQSSLTLKDPSYSVTVAVSADVIKATAS